MKKMKRFLVTLLSSLTAIACIAGITACNDKKEAATESSAANPSYDINLDLGLNKTCAHKYDVVYEIPATCTEDGTQYIGCTLCGESLGEKTIIKAAHAYAVADCTVASTCTVCGEEKGAALGHTYAIDAATCTDDKACTECGHVEEKATGHNMVNAFPTVLDPVATSIFDDITDLTKDEETGYFYLAATCTEDGFKPFKYCATCLEIWADSLTDDQILALFYGVDSEVEAIQIMFAESGVVTEGYEVIEAGHVFADFFTADADEDGNVDLIAATCTVKGLNNFKYCEVCDKDAVKLTTFADINDHFTKKDADENLVYVNEGYEAAVVAELGHTANGVDKDGKAYTTFVAGKPATCTAPGSAWKYTCTRCTASVAGEAPKALGHVYAKDAEGNEIAATCTEAVKCLVCEAIKTNALGHNMVAVAGANANAACTGSYVARVCTKCDAVETKAYEHNWGYVTASNYQSESALSCKQGVAKSDIAGFYKCSKCSEYGEKAYGVITVSSNMWQIQPVAHKQNENMKAATCSTAASNYFCTYGCGYAFIAEDQRAATGLHTYANGKVATCTEASEACSVCNAIAPKLDHKNADNTTAYVLVSAAVEATCTTAGNREYYQCQLCWDLAVKESGRYVTEVGTTLDNKVDITNEYLTIPAAGHNFTKTVAAQDSTCKVAGWDKYTACAACGTPETYIPYKALAICKGSLEGSCLTTIICDKAYIDVNGNGIYDAGDKVIAGCGEAIANPVVGEHQYVNGVCGVCAQEHTGCVYVDKVCPVCGKKEN